jgi:predicted oxidoreductase
MRTADFSSLEADSLLNTAFEAGIDFFDHADVYGGGKSEEVFAAALNRSSTAREKIILQSKCGIQPGHIATEVCRLEDCGQSVTVEIGQYRHDRQRYQCQHAN